MTKLELQDKKSLFLTEVREMLSVAQSEKRTMSELEESLVGSILKDLEDLNEEIREIDETNKKEIGDYKKVNIITKKEKKMDQRFSIGDTVKRNMNTGNYKFELRAAGLQKSTDAGGGYTVENENWDFIGPLSDALIGVGLGAKVHRGLVGNIDINTMGALTTAWATETGSATETGATFTQATFSPLRLTTVIPISNQLLQQSSYNLDQIIEEELIRQVKVKFEAALFAEADVSNAPNSVMSDGITDISGSLTLAKIVDLETNVAENNNLMGNLHYVTSAGGAAKLKSTVKVATYGEQTIMQDSVMNGYPTIVTNAIKNTYGAANDEAGLLFADFSDLNYYFWDNMDVLIDPYSGAAAGQTKLVLNAYMDGGFHRANSYKAASFGL